MAIAEIQRAAHIRAAKGVPFWAQTIERERTRLAQFSEKDVGRDSMELNGSRFR